MELEEKVVSPLLELQVVMSCVSEVCLPICICTTCMSDASGGQRRMSDYLELELGMVMSHLVGAGN